DNAFDVSEAAMALTASAETIPTRWPATSTTFGTEISTTGADVTFALRVGALALALKGGNATCAQLGATARDAAYCAARLCRVILTMRAVKPGSCKASSIFNLLAVLVRRLLGP